MNESTEPTGTTGKWTPELMAAHKARIEFMEAMGQAHYSRTDAQWHVAHFAKTIGAELEAEVSALKLQVDELKAKLKDSEGDHRQIHGLQLKVEELQKRQARPCVHPGCDNTAMRCMYHPYIEKRNPEPQMDEDDCSVCGWNGDRDEANDDGSPPSCWSRSMHETSDGKPICSHCRKV